MAKFRVSLGPNGVLLTVKLFFSGFFPFRLLKVYKKIHKMANIVSFFCNHEWVFTNDHTQNLWKKLSKTDQAIYNFNMKDMDWASYFHYYIRGMRIYLFKDDLSTLDSARTKWKR